MSASRPISLVKLLGVAAVAGISIGAALSWRQQREFERELADMERSAEAADFPLGVPPAPQQSLSQRPDPQLLKTIPAFPNAAPKDLFRGEMIAGSPMSVAWFETNETVDTVLEYYDEYYKLSGQAHKTHHYGPNSGYVAWFEETERLDAGVGEGLLHMVSAVRQGSSTVVLLSQTNPLATLAGATARELPEGVYLPEAARKPATLNMGEIFGGQLQIYSRVPSGELAGIGNDFVQHLKTSGWQVSEPELGESTWSISARKPGIEHTVALVSLPIAVDVVMTYRKTGD